MKTVLAGSKLKSAGQNRKKKEKNDLRQNASAKGTTEKATKW